MSINKTNGKFIPAVLITCCLVMICLASIYGVTTNVLISAYANSENSNDNIVDLDINPITEFTNVNYIANSNYFLQNPLHAPQNPTYNSQGTCTTVAMQMLLGYHNYYSDRRLIPEVATDGTRFLNMDYGNLIYHPTFDRTRVSGQGCARIGTEDSVYDEIYNLSAFPSFPGLGQAVGLVKNAAVQFVNNHAPAISGNVSITSGFFSPSTARADIAAGRPVVLGFQPIFTGADKFHVVLAYGYATLDGVQGFIVHYGWGDENVHVWVPSSWVGFQIRMEVNHIHNLVDTGININDTHRQLSCSACGYTTVDDLYNVSNNTITGTRYPLAGEITIPSAINNTIITTIGNSAFANTDITMVLYGNGGWNLTTIGNSAFSNCENLDFIWIPPSVTSIGSSVFSGCSSLRFITVASSNPTFASEDNILYDKVDWSFIHIPQALAGNVTIPSEITEIGDNAFADRIGLMSITFTNNIVGIGNAAFSGCTGITNLTIPNSVTSIGATAFENCNDLSIKWYYNTALAFPAQCKDKVTEIVVPEEIMTIPENAFLYFQGLNSVTISEGVINIGNYAFYGCIELETITIPNSVTNIGSDPFFGCTNLSATWHYNPSLTAIDFHLTSFLTTVNLEGVTQIAANAFKFCSNLENVTIPEGVMSIGDYAFAACSGLTEITIPNSVASIGTRAFQNCTNLENLYILRSPSYGITTLGSNAFIGCANLIAIFVPDLERQMAYTAASNWSDYSSNIFVQGIPLGLAYTLINDGTAYSVTGGTVTDENIIIPEFYNGFPVTEIGSYAFSYINISTIDIPNSITSIDNNAFWECAGLTEITIPNSVISLGNGAFWGCTGLTNVTILNGLTSIGNNAFYDCIVLEEIIIPNSVESIGNSAFEGCIGLDEITISSNVSSIANGTFVSCSSLESITIPNGVTSIGNLAFIDCIGLDEITIPDTVTSIGSYAFGWCAGLNEMTLPSSVLSIGDFAFRNCTGLTEITIPNSVTGIGWNAFYGCMNLSIIWHYNPAITAINIKNYLTSVNLDGVAQISANAFKDCVNMTRIIIPNSVTFIGNNAFQGCSNLTIYAQASSEPSGWDIDWNSSNCPVYWKASGCNPFLMSGFGYTTGTTYYWNGRVEMVANSSYCYKSGSVYAFIGDTNITFYVRTTSYNNYISKITGSLAFELKNSAGTVLQTHNSYVSVSAFNNMSISNGRFTINTANLDNGTYTLTLSSSFNRFWWSDSHTRTFTFVVDK